MKRNILFSVFCLTALFAPFNSVLAQEPTETFDLSTQTPVSGTNWHYDAERFEMCDGAWGKHVDENGKSCRDDHPRHDLPTLYVNDGANLRIIGSSTPEEVNLMVQVSGKVSITLDNASILRDGHSVFTADEPGSMVGHYTTVSPMQLSEGAHLTLTLVGENTLAMINELTAAWSAGLGVPYGSDLVIQGDGKLTATGGVSAAGIGGHQGGVPGNHFGLPGGNITINSGTIIATGNELGAGIGSGSNMQGGTITINGGNITATGGSQPYNVGAGGAGIGGGGSVSEAQEDWSYPSVININGGMVKATGGIGASGIGSGGDAGDNPFTININGGDIMATGSVSFDKQGKEYASGAGIGSGYNTSGKDINIRGGRIIATSGGENPSWGGGAGIGGGARLTVKGNIGGNINISGGTIFVRGGKGAANIGNGSLTVGPGEFQTDELETVRISPAATISNDIPAQ